MMHVHTIHIHARVLVIMLLLSALWIPFVVSANSTSVSNYVHVNTSGDGTAHASVQSTINGKQVENVNLSSNNGSINYAKTITEKNGIITSANPTASTSIPRHTTYVATNTILRTTDRERELRQALQQLLTLLQYYVSLLTQQ